MTMTLDGTAGMTAPVGAIYNGLTLMTAQNSTSGTAIDFTGIPLWARRITVMFNNVSTNGTSNLLIQFGSGSILTSGYTGSASQNATTTANSSGFLATQYTIAANFVIGLYVFTNLSGNVWVGSGVIAFNSGDQPNLVGGAVTLSGTLDRLRVTTVGGTNTFDNGSINVMYE